MFSKSNHHHIRNLGIGAATLLSQKRMKNVFPYENVAGSTNRSYVRLHTGLPPVRGVLPGHITYQDEFSTTFTLAGNTSNLACLYALGTYNHWTQAVTVSSGSANLDVEGYAPWFDLDPMEGIPASNLIAAKTGSGMSRMALTDSEVYIDFQNNTSLPLYVKLHWFVAKSNNKYSPVRLLADNVTSRALYNSTYAFPATAGTKSATSGNLKVNYTARSNTINSSEGLQMPPYHNLRSTGLSKEYKKIGDKTLTLAGGDTHRMAIHTGHNQFAIQENFVEDLLTYVRGSVFCAIEFQGTAAFDSTAATGTYGLSAGKLSCVVTRKCHLAPMKAPNKRATTEYYGNQTVSGSAATAVYNTIVPTTFQNLSAVTQ